MKNNRAYPWPASALTAEDMACLYRVREGNQPRTPMTELIACAVRRAYADEAQNQTENQTIRRVPHLVVLPPPERKEAA